MRVCGVGRRRGREEGKRRGEWCGVVCVVCVWCVCVVCVVGVVWWVCVNFSLSVFTHPQRHRIRGSSTVPHHLFVTNIFFHGGIALPILPQISQKKKGAFGRHAKKTRKYNSVE